MRGKLIVIEGTDGSGKTTQLSILKHYLEKNNYSVETIDFPRYAESFHARTVAKYLAGEFGEVNSVSPYLISLAYALDRASAKREMNAWLREGKIILANRYATSNMAHQAAKLPEDAQEDFLKWVTELEYKINKIPKEDLVIYLHVPTSASKALTKKRGRQDLHEKDSEFLDKSGQMYEKLASGFKHWARINCVSKNGLMRPKEKIHKEILKVLKKRHMI